MVEVLGEDHRDGKEGEADDEEIALRVQLVPEKIGPGNLQDAVRTARVVPVVKGDAGHLAEAQRHDGEVVAAEAQRRIPEDRSGRAGEEHRQRQRGEEVPVGLRHQQRARVGADREEGGVAEVQKARVADHDVEAQPEHRVRCNRDADGRHVVVAVRQHGATHRAEDHDDSHPEREPGQLIAGRDVRASHAMVGQPVDHIRSATRSPNRPVGLTIRTVIRTPNTITSFHLPER